MKRFPILSFQIPETHPESPRCRDCGQPLDVITQPSWNGKTSIQLWTCFSSDSCLLNGVTLSPAEYNRLSDAQWEEYRKVNRARLAGKAVAS